NFALQTLPFRVESDETPKFPHAPATMAGGVAVFDFNKDGRPDIFFTNGANIETLKKDSPKFSNRLFRNDGNGVFTDVTAKAGLDRSRDPKFGLLWATTAAWVDVNNDGLLDLFVVNYLEWDSKTEHLCGPSTAYDYCSPKFYEGQPNQLF